MTALLEARGLTKTFPIGGTLSRRETVAVDDVSFTLGAAGAEIFTIIGESGSGKTTLSRMILGLERPSSGTLRFQGQPVGPLGRAERLAFMSKVQPVFQNPFEAFNPLKPVDRYLASTVRTFRKLTDRASIEKAMDEVLQKVGLSLAEVRGRYPHEMSGGQLQRAAIARALIPNPALIIADEPVSMVDASLRMAIVNLLRQLRDDLGVTVIYITHDLATAYYISDRLMIMQKGRVVEMGPARAILDAPEHPYTQQLKGAVLSVDEPNVSEVSAPSSPVLSGVPPGVLVESTSGRLVRREAGIHAK
jgi:ABC-type oligopeptide transport system ATPase subunit